MVGTITTGARAPHSRLNAKISSAVGFFEVFGVLTAGVFLTLVRLYLRRIPTLAATGPLPLGWPVAGSVLLALLAVLRVAVFAPGLVL